MDGSSYKLTSQLTSNPRHGRNQSQPTHLSDSHRISEHHQPRHTRPNMDSMPSDHQRAFINKLPTAHRPTHETLSNIATPSTLHFEYHTRYPSPPPTEGGFPTPLSANPPSFAYPSPSSAQRSIRDRPPNDRRPGSSPSPPPNHALHHRPTGSSSSAGGSPMITLPPLSNGQHRPPSHRGVDQGPNHQHVEVPAMQRKPSLTQLPRDHPEQAPHRRHTLDSSHVPDQQIIPGTRKRTMSSLSQPNYPPPPHHHHHRPPIQNGTQQAPPQPVPPPQPNQNAHVYSTPLPTPRHENIPNSPTPSSPTSASQPSQLPPQSHPQSPDDALSPTSDNSIVEAADTALEPLRLGFESIWVQTVQNVRQVMTKMQRDLNRLITAERRKNVNLMRCLVSNSEKLKNHEWAVEELRKENGLLADKAVENDQLRRENTQKITLIDTLNQENHALRTENDDLKKKNDEAKDALNRATEVIFQYKEELAKVKADAENFRKSLFANEARPATPPELHRLHAEKMRERIFNDAVKQLRALTALEDSNLDTTRERDSEEALMVKTVMSGADGDQDRRTGSSSLESLKGNPSPLSVIHEQPRPVPIRAVSTHNGNKPPRAEADKPLDSREIIDVEIDQEVVRPIGGTPIDVQTFESMPPPTDESRNMEEVQPDPEVQRQRQRQARRGPTPPSPPQQRSRKPSPVTLKTGMKRNREEYEDGQIDEDLNMIEKPGMENGREEAGGGPHSNLAEPEVILHSDAEEEVVVVLEREQREENTVNNYHRTTRQKGKKVSTDGIQQQQQQQMEMSAAVKDAHPKAVGRWTYYSHYRDSSGGGAPAKSYCTQQPSTSKATPPSPPAPRLAKKLGISHMDLLYKTEKEVMVCRICLSLEHSVDASTTERRKAKANTKKFPLNASWADLINHCQTEHTKACEDMEKLSPSQLAEMKQRMPQAAASMR